MQMDWGLWFMQREKKNEYRLGNVNISVRQRVDEARFGSGLNANIQLLKNIVRVNYFGNR